MRNGSALILTVVISVLLAMIAALFILRTSVDSVGTLAVSDNKELLFAVDTVVEQLNNQLVLDVPNSSPSTQEYQDYPWTNAARGKYLIGNDPCTLSTFNMRQGAADTTWLKDDRWLASLEPYKDTAGNYFWQHITDLYGDRRYYDSTGTGSFPDAASNIQAAIVSDTASVSAAAADFKAKPPLADADGDGVADSMWVPVRTEITPYDYTYIPTYNPNSSKIVPAMLRSDDNRYLRTSKGKQVYVALRVVDEGGMLNVNTGYQFLSTSTVPTQVDGSSVMQVNLAALQETSGNMGELDKAWNGGNTGIVLSDYENKVVRQLDNPQGNYTPFDIGDELEFRYRNLLNQTGVDTRSEVLTGWGFRTIHNLWSPAVDLPTWYQNTKYFSTADAEYAKRHISTTFNCDRLIAPDGSDLLYINTATPQQVYDQLDNMNTARKNAGKSSLGADALAQLAVNIVDYRDGDFKPSALTIGTAGTHYGHSAPFVWISEVAFSRTSTMAGPGVCFAIEYYAPSTACPDTNFRLKINNVVWDSFTLSPVWGASNYRVLVYNDPSSTSPLLTDPTAITFTSPFFFQEGAVLQLEKEIGSTGVWVPVDHCTLPATGWSLVDTLPVSMQRDITAPHCMYRQWNGAMNLLPTLGAANIFTASVPSLQYETPGGPYVTLGDVGKVLKVSTDDDIWYSTVPADESDVRFNWSSSPDMDDFASYFTVMQSIVTGQKIYGRINVNTAPEFVIAQLPWVSQREKYQFSLNPVGPPAFISTQVPWSSNRLAEAIVAYRDKHAIAGGPDYTDRNTVAPSLLGTGLTGLRNDLGLAGIAELGHVVTSSAARAANSALVDYGIDWYATDYDIDTPPQPVDQAALPDLSLDGMPNDIEERDLILSRISNLVTVRSDVFCAYILVRLGEDGPQQRYIAILDRSDVKNATGKVKIRALQPVADPR